METINQICADYSYIYAANILGLNIYEINNEAKYAFITYSGGFSTVWSNDDKIFVGTACSGIKYFNKPCISGSHVNPYNLSACLNDFSDLTCYDELTSDYIKYLHGSADVLLVITNSGIDVVKINPQSYRSSSTIVSGMKGFMTSTGKFYYTVSGSNEWSVHRVNTCLFDWSIPDAEYKTGGSIFVTENTSSDGISNTLFIATSSGVYMIDEGSNKYNIYYKE